MNPVPNSKRVGDSAATDLRGDPAGLERVIARLANENRRLRTRARGLQAGLLVVVAAFCMGVAPSARVPDVLSARAFELVGDSGEVRATLTARGDSGFDVVVLDAAGKPTAGLRLAGVKPHLVVQDANGTMYPAVATAGVGAVVATEVAGAAPSAAPASPSASATTSAGVAAVPVAASSPEPAAEQAEQAPPEKKKGFWSRWGDDEPADEDSDGKFDWDYN